MKFPLKSFTPSAVICHQSVSKKFRLVCRHSLSKKIKSLFLAAEDLDRCYTYEEWLYGQMLDDYKNNYWYWEKISESDLQGQFSRYRKCYTEQEDIVRRGVHLTSLSKFFESCPNLNTLAVSLTQGIRWPDEMPKILRRELLSLENELRPHSSTKELADILRVAGEAKIQFKHLAIGYLPLECITPDSSDIQEIKKVLSSLESLFLGVRHGPSEPSMSGSGWYGYYYEVDGLDVIKGADELEVHLSRFISGAANLRHLLVETRTDHERWLDDCLLTSLFDDCIFKDALPKLCSISLQGIRTEGKKFHEFLLAHKNTLKYILLRNIHLEAQVDETTWNVFFETISTQLPRARSILCYGTFQDTEGELDFGMPKKGRSSFTTHAMDKYLRKGGIPPYDRDTENHHIPHPVIYKESNSGLRYIEDPDTDDEESEEEEERFYKLREYSW